MTFEQTISPKYLNPGCRATWNCPACYKLLLNVKPGRAICNKCGAELELSVESQPVSVSTFIHDGRGGRDEPSE